MKRILRFAAAFVVVALAAFLAGYFLEHGAVTEARNATTACTAQLDDAKRANDHSQILLELYRAETEIERSNFGNAADLLAKTRGALASPDPKVLAAIDAAIDATKKNDTAAAGHVHDAIGLLETR